jgi:hypothetical protein
MIIVGAGYGGGRGRRIWIGIVEFWEVSRQVFEGSVPKKALSLMKAPVP